MVSKKKKKERGRCVKITARRVEFKSGVMILSNCDCPASPTRVRLLSFRHGNERATGPRL